MKKRLLITGCIILLCTQILFVSGCATTGPMTAGEIREVYSDKTVYYPDGQAEYMKGNGTTFYDSDRRGLITGKWFAKEGELCFKYGYSAKTFCHKMEKKDDEVLQNEKPISLKPGDPDGLESRYRRKMVSSRSSKSKKSSGSKSSFWSKLAGVAAAAVLGVNALAAGARKAQEKGWTSSESNYGSLFVSTGSWCGEGNIRVKNLDHHDEKDLECCEWGNLGSKTYTLYKGGYELSYSIKGCGGKYHSYKGVKFTIYPGEQTKLHLNFDGGSYHVEYE